MRDTNTNGDDTLTPWMVRFVERFGRLVAEEEREECAKVCDKLVDQEIRTGKVDHNEMPWTMYCSNIIRARGEP
jgi:hypothetical protein